MLKTVDSVIEVLGGPTKTGAIVGVSPAAVVNWRTRREIPSNWFLVINAALADMKLEAAPSVFGFKEEANS